MTDTCGTTHATLIPEGKGKVYMRLAGEDGNAFSIMGRFLRAAGNAGWTRAEAEKVNDHAMAGDYDHLLRTFIGVTDSTAECDEDESPPECAECLNEVYIPGELCADCDE
jgi:hypothetical protein